MHNCVMRDGVQSKNITLEREGLKKVFPIPYPFKWNSPYCSYILLYQQT